MNIHLSNTLLADFVGGEVTIGADSLGEVESISLQGDELHITSRLGSEQKETHVPVWGNPPLGEYIGLGRVELAHQYPTVTLFPPNYFRKHHA